MILPRVTTLPMSLLLVIHGPTELRQPQGPTRPCFCRWKTLTSLHHHFHFSFRLVLIVGELLQAARACDLAPRRRFRTPLPVRWPVLDVQTIYRQCSVIYIGYQCASASTSRWPRSSTSRSLSGVSPPYLADDYRLVADARERRLRYADTQHLWRQSVLGCWTRSMEQSSIAPEDADLSCNEFRRSLKTFLFGQWGHGAVWTLLTASFVLTYLLLRARYHFLLNLWTATSGHHSLKTCDKSYKAFLVLLDNNHFIVRLYI